MRRNQGSGFDRVRGAPVLSGYVDLRMLRRGVRRNRIGGEMGDTLELDYERELREALEMWQWELDRSLAEIQKLQEVLNDIAV